MKSIIHSNTMSNDILKQLNLDDIKELANIYEKQKQTFPYIHSFIQNCIKALEIGMKEYVTIYSPGDFWRKDGTFIASMPNYGPDIVLHSLDPSGKNLQDALLKSSKFKFLKDPSRYYTCFYAVHEWFFPKILQMTSEHFKLNVSYAEEMFVMCLEKEKALQFDITQCPDEVYVAAIQPEDFQVIKQHWPYSWKSTERKLEDWTKLKNGFGVYLKSNNKLVSWVTSSCLGQMCALQTLDEHKKKGYAQLVIKHMAKYLAELGFDCCGTVHPTNVASLELFSKLGFNSIYKCAYICIVHKGQSPEVDDKLPSH
ncbi:uncharacterized protein [Euwallacea fornicatus]|uniref:uncharacterized protein n=1 Tax=Euwallacea fornicatus TaxID=995702 RepID=UPI00338E7FDF